MLAAERAVEYLSPDQRIGIMAKDTGKGSRKGAVTARTQSKDQKTGDYTKRNETPGAKRRASSWT